MDDLSEDDRKIICRIGQLGLKHEHRYTMSDDEALAIYSVGVQTFFHTLVTLPVAQRAEMERKRALIERFVDLWRTEHDEVVGPIDSLVEGLLLSMKKKP